MVLPDGHFYIGSTTKELKNYNGSGAEWQRYKKGKGFTNQDITKEIIFQNFENEEEMRDFERKEIEKNIKDSFCLNRNIQAGCSKEIARKHACPECGGKGGNHFKGCLKYKEPESCPECRGKLESIEKVVQKLQFVKNVVLAEDIRKPVLNIKLNLVLNVVE